MNSGPSVNAGYQEFQLFQMGNEFTILFHPINSKLPPVAPEKIGVDWDKFRSGLRTALRALYKNKDFDVMGVSVLTDPDGTWEYRVLFKDG
jgi:hypothetical protein